MNEIVDIAKEVEKLIKYTNRWFDTLQKGYNIAKSGIQDEILKGVLEICLMTLKYTKIL